MRAAHALALALMVPAGILAGILVSSYRDEGNGDPAHPDLGILSPVLSEPTLPRPVARLDGAAGRIEDLAASGDTLAILTREHWFLKVGDSLRGGFGDPSPGSPEWLSRGVSIALDGGRVYILEAGRRVLSEWDAQGARLGEARLSLGEDRSFQPAQIVVSPVHGPVVVSLRLGADGAARWEGRALGEGADGERVLLQIAGRSSSPVFDRPVLAVRDTGILGINALDHVVFRVEEGVQTPAPHLRRRDPPLWYVPRRVRRHYRDLLLGMRDAPTVGLSALPETWPSVRDFTVTEDGRLVLAVSAGEDVQHIEVLAGDGTPLFRLSVDGFTQPVFLDDGRAFLVQEELRQTVIHELEIPRH